MNNLNFNAKGTLQIWQVEKLLFSEEDYQAKAKALSLAYPGCAIRFMSSGMDYTEIWLNGRLDRSGPFSRTTLVHGS